jgi:hypothetical protein
MGEAWCVVARKIGGCRVFWTVLAGLFLLVLAAPSGAFAGARITPRDRAATRAYLAARYVYVQALVASAPAAKAAEEEFASILGGECPGVLTGAPQETLRTLLAPSPRPRTPRQMGEANRESRQLGDLQGELSLALGLPLVNPHHDPPETLNLGRYPSLPSGTQFARKGELRSGDWIGLLTWNSDNDLDEIAPKRRDSFRWILPTLPGHAELMSPLMTWWTLLFGLSIFARYHPEMWAEALDVDQSKTAVPLEAILDSAMSALPRLIYNELA